MFICDCHCDTLTELYKKGSSLYANDQHFDIQRQIALGGGLQFCAIFVPTHEFRYYGGLRYTLQLLDKYLFAIDLDRSKNCYIANIVKCRPPQNRDPLPAESEACMPWLREQFRLLHPKIVVCLGRVAAQRMIRQDFSVTREHGQIIEKGGILFMGTFHPAALLRQPQNKPEAFADFTVLRDTIAAVCEHTYHK